MEKAPACSRPHAVADEGVPFNEIATTIGRNLNLPVRGIAVPEAHDRFGFLGSLAPMDNPTSVAITCYLLDWTPVKAGLIAGLDQGHYFQP